MLYLRGRVVCLWLWRRTGNHHKIELAAMVRRELEAQRQTEDCLLACLLLLVLAALTNQSRRFGFRLSFFFFLDGPRRGIPAFSSQLVAHRGDRAAAALPPFGTAHSASGVSESAGGRSTAQLVRSQRPAGLPAAPSQATARRPTSQLLQRAYVCVVLPCTLLRRIEREILRAACHAHAARPRRF